VTSYLLSLWSEQVTWEIDLYKYFFSLYFWSKNLKGFLIALHLALNLILVHMIDCSLGRPSFITKPFHPKEILRKTLCEIYYTFFFTTLDSGVFIPNLYEHSLGRRECVQSAIKKTNARVFAHRKNSLNIDCDRSRKT
jgi:hypothetical protein